MTLNRAHLFLALALTLGGGALAACVTLPTVPAAGTVIDEKFMQDYHPTYKPGMKWTYRHTATGSITLKSESTMEVLTVQGDVMTVKLSSKPDGSSEVTSDTGTMSTKPQAKLKVENVELTLKSEGPADVTVPYKEFKGIAKVSMINSSQTYYAWYAPGIGLVKSEMTNSAGGTTFSGTTELKDFVSP